MPEEKKSNYTGKNIEPGGAGKEPGTDNDEQDEKKIKQVTTGQAIQRKKSIGRRIVESFTGDDMQSVSSYVFFDVLIPAAKTMVTDAIVQGLERALWGDNRPRSSSRSGYTNYSKISSRGSTRSDSGWRREREEPRTLSSRARGSYDFRDVVIETRVEAVEVRDQLLEILDDYQQVSVSDLLALVGITGSFVDNKWGWTKEMLYGIDIRPVRGGGYTLTLPRPEEIS